MIDPSYRPAVQSPAFKQRILDRKRVASQSVISGYAAETAKFDLIEFEAERLLFRLSAEVLSERVESRKQEARIDLPATWWQHFKQDYAKTRWLGWFVRRRGVRVTARTCEVRFEGYRHYPDASIALPQDRFGTPVVFETVSYGDWMPSE